MKPISVIGGICQDMRARPLGELRPGSSEPGEIAFTPGGVARNIAENLARLQVPTQLFGWVGADAAGKGIRALTQQAGVDISAVATHPDLPTATDLSVLDAQGDLHVALADIRICGALDLAYLRQHQTRLLNASYLIADANLSLEVLQWLIDRCEQSGVALLLEPVSFHHTARIRELRGRIFALSPNQAEWDIFQAEATELYPDHVFITRGAKGVVHRTGLGSEISYPAIPVSLLDSIGAGDAFVAGLVYGLWQNKEIGEAIGLGIAAASLTLQDTASVTPHISPEALEKLLYF